MTNKRKWTAMLLGVCILLSLLTACAPAGTSVGSSSVPETVSSAPATSSDASSISAPSSETTSEAPSSVSSASSENSPVRTGYWFEEIPSERFETILAWSYIVPGWMTASYQKLYYSGELVTAIPGYHRNQKSSYSVARGMLLYVLCNGPELYLQEAPDAMPEVVCELPLYEQITRISYLPTVNNPDDPNVFALTKRSQIYHFNLDTKKLTHLLELPSEEEDILDWGVDLVSGKVSVRAATEETYRLWEELETRKGDTISYEEKVAQAREIFFSLDIYNVDLETGVKTPLTEKEYAESFAQMSP